MKLKTLLLSSAAAFAFVGGAQAADLSVAEPVDYVKVCDAFGAGYYYIPGTDTCLKIGGYVQFDVNFHDSSKTLGGSSTTDITLPSGFPVDFSHPAGVNDSTGTLPANDHYAGWDMGTEASLTATVKSMTEYGPLTGFIDFRAKSNNGQAAYSNTLIPRDPNAFDNTIVVSTGYNSTDKNAYIDSAYLELGMLLAGRTGSVYDYSGGFNFDGSDFDSDASADQVRLTWAMSGMGIQLAIEDPRDRWGTGLPSSYSTPNIVGNITWSQSNWDAQLSGGFAETAAGSGFGAQLATTIKLDSIAPGDQLRLKGAFAQNEVASFAASNDGSAAGELAVAPLTGGSTWSFLASFQHFWAPNLSSAVTFDYMNQGAGTVPTYLSPSTGNPVVGAVSGSFNQYSVYGNLVWAPVTGFSAGAEVGYIKASTATDGTWSAKVRLKRSW
jgi:hypothetical protein